MRKLKLFSILLLSSFFLFTSCVDYVQSISFDGENYNGYMRVTFSKGLLAVAEIDPEEELLTEEDIVNFPGDFKISEVSTEMEKGISLRFSENKNNLSYEQQKFIPIYDPTLDLYYIPFFLGEGENQEEIQESIENEEDELTNGMTALMLSTTKCKIMIDKNVIPVINNVYFEGKDTEIDYKLSYFDYGNGYCIEIPFLLLVDDFPYDLTHIIVD